MLFHYIPVLVPRILRQHLVYISCSSLLLQFSPALRRAPATNQSPRADLATQASPMGSLPSPPPRPLSPESPPNIFRIYASFCPREPTEGTSMSNWLEFYNPADNTWHRIGTIPGITEECVLKGFAMVPLGDSIYIIGGRLCRKDPGINGNDPVEADLAVRADVLRYNVVTGEWSACASLGVPRFDFACTACDNMIYVAGGQCTLLQARGTSSAEVYDPVQDRWAALPRMSTLRYKCVGVTWEGRFHVVGGFAERADTDGTILPQWVERSSAEVYDAERGEWELMLGMWQLDVPPNQIVAVEDRLFSSGDCLNTWKGHIETYDGKLGIWNIIERSHIQDLASLLISDDAVPGPSLRRTFLTMAPIGTWLYFLAGYRLPGSTFRRVLSVVHVFDTLGTGEGWSSFEPVREDTDKELCTHCCPVQVA